MTKYYVQPDWAGGRKVKARDVCRNLYTIYCSESGIDEPEHLEVMEHENNACWTKEDVAKHFNYFATKAEAEQARKDILKILKGKK